MRSYDRTSEKQVKSVCTILAPINENTVDSQENNQDFTNNRHQAYTCKCSEAFEAIEFPASHRVYIPHKSQFEVN